MSRTADSNEALRTASALFRAIEAKDPEAVAALYADDIQVWHNFSNTCQDKAANLETLTGLCSNVPEIHYDVAERRLLDDGRVLQRHVLRAGNGEQEVQIPACIFVTVRDGRIAAIHEYLDTAQANQLRALTGRPPVGS